MEYKVFCAGSVVELEDMINEIGIALTMIGGVDVSVVDGVPRFCQATWVHRSYQVYTDIQNAERVVIGDRR
jgi:hypothetical protein